MKNIFLIFLLLLISNCQRNQVIKTHGISYLENRQKELIINTSNKNDIRETLGNPSTKGLIDETVWIYIERTQTRGKLLELGRNITYRNNVLVLEFNKYGILTNKEFYDKEKMNKLKFAKKKTEGITREKDFIYSFLSSIRQKMYKRN